MNEILVNLIEGWEQFKTFSLGLLVPIRLYQVLLLLALFVLAHFTARWISPRFTEWARRLGGMKAWQLRVIVVINRRLRGILFALFAWLVYAAMQTE